MEIHEYPYYGLGMIAYSIALSDGKIQVSERNELRSIVRDWSRDIECDFDVSEIIFSVMNRTPVDSEWGYEHGIKYIKQGSEFVDEKLKEKFLYLINDIAHAFPPVTTSERTVLERFEADLKNL